MNGSYLHIEETKANDSGSNGSNGWQYEMNEIYSMDVDRTTGEISNIYVNSNEPTALRWSFSWMFFFMN